MDKPFPHQHLDPLRTPWHITFGTYGTRLHGGERPTVDKQHHGLGESFVTVSPQREQFDRARLKFPSRLLTPAQSEFAENQLPAICERGGWGYRVCSAASDHMHLLCDVKPEIHGEKVRRLVKRWLGQALSEKWPLQEGATWWAEEGSNIAIHQESYLNNAFKYIAKQRTTPWQR
jgi:REP element-mobilizing transposase RayT